MLGALVIVSGCADRHIYENETFESKDFYTHEFNATPNVVMRACRNAALQAQYVIQEENAASRFLRAFKSNHVADQDDIYAGLTIEVNVSPASPQTSMVRTVAVERQYEVTKNREFAQAGIGPLVNIPLLTGETQTVTEIRRDTIDEREFYKRLYQAIEAQITQAATELTLEGSERGTPVAKSLMSPQTIKQEVAPPTEIVRMQEPILESAQASVQEPMLEPEPLPINVPEDRPLRRGEVRRIFFIPER